ncbi:MAG: 1-(5-phosphoribosyl)-5-[Clostridia bacterium]|nr:1-(5-phosphoribosyl)-5-[(5-phosphoribosylamino)methylideneamino]imidazole-4-carboxamide isomerase [Clostridia bacterium]MBR2874626.1 1-(5-phosphoribosyl)-5-[(5-phosphoribosylamino)methylideneamino]imidazole-4-carboxamide isomerase [Clostridia bacterium]
MQLYPAIDLYDKKAVRLFKGDYSKMTVYSNDPLSVALDFESKGAKYIHLVDLEGAKDGTTPNLDVVKKIANNTNLFVEIGGGIRDMQRIDEYLNNGVDRVILGTAAVNDREFLTEALKKYGEKIAVGVDVKDGYVAIKGWVEKSQYSGFEFCKMMQDLGVKTIICTDISKDGAMQGTNVNLYQRLSKELSLDIIASGGVSSYEDILALKELGIHGAIIGKAYYVGAIDLEVALKEVLK